MIYLSTDINKKTKGWNKDNTYIVSDFDCTITKTESKNSWGMFNTIPGISKMYERERKAVYKEFSPYENDIDISDSKRSEYMNEWTKKHLELIIKYKISEEQVLKISTNKENMEFRAGARDFLKKAAAEEIPIIFISAGIRNIIYNFLEEKNCLFENITLISNQLKYKKGIINGISNEMIHSNNKSGIKFSDITNEKIKERENRILLGDALTDIKMINTEQREAALKIGFLRDPKMLDEYMEVFDIVVTEESSYLVLMEVMNIF